MNRRGASLLECAVYTLVALLVLGALRGILGTGVSNSTRTVAHEDAMRSALLALELIGQDVRRTLLADENATLDTGDGSTLALDVVTLDRSDFWKLATSHVTWALEPGTMRRLVRREAAARTVVAGCALSDIQFRFVTPGVDTPDGSTPWRRFLQITVKAPIARGGEDAFSAIVPLSTRCAPPAVPMPSGAVSP